jgi:hypothetical protein
MALKVLEGVVDQLGPISPLTADAGQTGMAWAFVRFSRDMRKPVILERVVADPTMGAYLAPGAGGRFAFYRHAGRFVLCGFRGPHGVAIADPARDPIKIATQAIRTPAKRKIFWGALLILTLAGLAHGIGMIKAGRLVLAQNPSPKMPAEARVRRALTGQFYWPF